MQVYLHDCALAHWPAFGERGRKKTEMRFGRSVLNESFIHEAAQQGVLTEVQEAGEQQQQVGGSGVHPDWWWFTAVRLKYRRPRRQRPEGRSEEQGRDMVRERWRAWKTNSWCFRLWWWWWCQRGCSSSYRTHSLCSFPDQEMAVTSSRIPPSSPFTMSLLGRERRENQ